MDFSSLNLWSCVFETIKTVNLQHSANLMQPSIQPVTQNLMEDAVGMNFLQHLTTENTEDTSRPCVNTFLLLCHPYWFPPHSLIKKISEL